MEKYLKESLTIRGIELNRLFIFDLDNTLIISDVKIKVVDPETGEIIKELTPKEFNNYINIKSHLLNFDDFLNYNLLLKSKLTKYFKILEKEYNNGTHIAIVTARSDSDLVRKFFLTKQIKIHRDLCVAINDVKWGFKFSTVEDGKACAVKRFIELGYNDITVFDDNEKNLKRIKDLEKNYLIKVKTIKV